MTRDMIINKKVERWCIIFQRHQLHKLLLALIIHIILLIHPLTIIAIRKKCRDVVDDEVEDVANDKRHDDQEKGIEIVDN